jgi:hypothetical protein
MFIEEFDPTQGDPPSAAGGFLHIRQVQEVLAKVLLINLVWWLLTVFDQLPHCAQIPFLGLFRKTSQLHIFHHSLS